MTSTKNSIATLYSGNKILLDAYLDIRPDSSGNQENLNLAYYLTCGSSKTIIKNKEVEYADGNPQLITLDEIPPLGITNNQNIWTVGAIIPRGELIGQIGVTAKPTSSGNTIIPAFNVVGAIIDGQNIDFRESVTLSPSFLESNSNSLAQINNYLKNFQNSNSILLKLDRDVQGVDFWFKTVDSLEYTDEFKAKISGACDGDVNKAIDKTDCINELISQESGQIYLVASALSDQQNFGAPIKQEITETENLENVRAGSCTLNMRLIPNSVAPPNTISEFNNFSSFGDNIQTDPSLSNKAFEIQFNVGRNTQIGSTSYTNLEIARPYPRQSFCAVGIKEIKVDVPLVNSQVSYDYESTSNIDKLKAKVSFAKQVRDIGELSFTKKESESYYTTTIPLEGYTLPKGSESEEVTLYVTYTPQAKDGKKGTPKSIEQTFVLNDCSVGGTPAPSGTGSSGGTGAVPGAPPSN
jgi:hypothetical protein